MSEHEAFVAAIAAAPDDDTPRLVYADFLEEHGDAARAGFIRDQVRLAKLRPGTDECRQLFRRTADTLKANLPAWIQSACEAFGQPAEWWPWKTLGYGLRVGLGERFSGWKSKAPLYGIDLTRGLIEHAFLTPSNFFKTRNPQTPPGYDSFFHENPVTRLTLFNGFDKEEFHNVSPAALNRIHSLTLEGDSVISNTFDLFQVPVWTGVKRVSLMIGDGAAAAFCRSPLSKQIAALQIKYSTEELRGLAHYPLDDRLQLFTVSAPYKVVVASHRIHLPPRTRSADPVNWSLLPQVPFRPTLKRLDLTGCTIGDRGLAAFARAEVWVRLRALVLDRNRFGDPGWRDFVRSRRTPELTLLSASRNFVTGDGAARLAQSPLVATLQYVDLRGNRIDGKGAVALARGFGDGPLKKLLLAGNPIPPRDAETVRTILGERVAV